LIGDYRSSIMANLVKIVSWKRSVCMCNSL